MSVSEKSADYAREVYREAERRSASAWSWTTASDKIGYKIREAQQVDRVRYMLVIGAKEAEEGTVAVRDRDSGETTTMTIDELIAKLHDEINSRKF